MRRPIKCLLLQHKLLQTLHSEAFCRGGLLRASAGHALSRISFAPSDVLEVEPEKK